MNHKTENNFASKIAVLNLTALWALSESFLGGVLHALKVPFKGLIIGNIAVIIIVFLAYYSSQRGIILKACVIALIIKALISPHTPITAYLSVFIQGLLGEILFWNRNFMTVSAIFLGIITSTLSSLQRVIILTLVFGQTLWETIDQFSILVHKELLNAESPRDFKLSNWLIGIYVGIHVLVGMITGIYASRLAKKIKSEKIYDRDFIEVEVKNILTAGSNDSVLKKVKQKHKRYKILQIILYFFLLLILVLSYTINDNGYFNSKSIWIMIIRSLIIMLLWFKLASPLLQKFFRSRITKSRNKYFEDVENILSIFPFLKALIKYAWKSSSSIPGFKKISHFLILTLSILLTYDFREKEPI